jgi:hypothetical protein
MRRASPRTLRSPRPVGQLCCVGRFCDLRKQWPLSRLECLAPPEGRVCRSAARRTCQLGKPHSVARVVGGTVPAKGRSANECARRRPERRADETRCKTSGWRSFGRGGGTVVRGLRQCGPARKLGVIDLHHPGRPGSGSWGRSAGCASPATRAREDPAREGAERGTQPRRTSDTGEGGAGVSRRTGGSEHPRLRVRCPSQE